MDQDFHYYGTYYAARTGGFEETEATLIAKSANFVDFCTESKYAAYWQLVTDTKKTDKYSVVGKLDYPRYTFQGGLFGSLVSPEDGLWCSYHFTPGNFDDPSGTPSREDVHGADVDKFLPPFVKRDTTRGKGLIEKYDEKSLGDFEYGELLNRPQSALSRELIRDTIRCATDDSRLESILLHAECGNDILKNDREDNLRRMKLILMGIRSHVIADTWAHQDFCGLSNVMNTYWDVKYDPSSWNPMKMGYGRQSVDYNDGTSAGWTNVVLSGAEAAAGRLSKNLEATPNGTSYLGHGWIGHLPDFSFVKFRYKPCWNGAEEVIERNNPKEYLAAWGELVSLFAQANGNGHLKLDEEIKSVFNRAETAISTPCDISANGTGRKSSAEAWKDAFGDLPKSIINVDLEPDLHAVLDGMLEETDAKHRYGTNFVNVYSDLYLFQIAADYHFHFVKNYLEANNLYIFTGSWSSHSGALSPAVSELFDFVK